MTQFFDTTLSGISLGMQIAAIALALVLIWRATRVVNFAQGGMALICAYLAFSVTQATGSYWLGFVTALVSGLVLGAVIERVLIRQVENRPPLNAVIVTLGLLIVIEAVAGMAYGVDRRGFAYAFDFRGFQIGGTVIGFAPADLFAVLSVLAAAVGLGLLFRFTSLGLRMRAAAFEPEVARLLGVRVGRMLTLGWALAAVAGALAGMLTAPPFIFPNELDSAFVFGFTAAVIGGLDSPLGAVVGGLVLGLALSYVSGYVGDYLQTVAALGILVAILMIRPSGLFSRTTTRRV